MNHRKTLLAASIVAGLCLSVGAYAQDSTQNTNTGSTGSTANAGKPDKVKQLSTVTVTGIRNSEALSLDTKQAADSHVEVVSATDIGKLPAKNVADTIAQLPGVNISDAAGAEGGFDEADRASLRGSAPSLTLTTVDGHNIGSGDWFITGGGGTRSVSYAMLPSEIVSQVVVHKTSEASLLEGGAAGTIDIITRKPLEFSKQFSAEASVGGVYSSLPSSTKPQFNGLVNWKNDDSSFGVLAQVFYEDRELQRDGQEMLGYSYIPTGSAAAKQLGLGAATPGSASTGVFYPNLPGSALFTQERKRKGASIDLEWKPLNSLTVNLDAFYSHMDATDYNRNYMLRLRDRVPTSTLSNYTLDGNVLSSATLAGASGVSQGIYDMISRPGESESSQYITLDANWQATQNLNFKFQLGTTKGTGNTPVQDIMEMDTGYGASSSYSMNGLSSPMGVSLGGNNGTYNPATVGLDWIFGDQGIHVVDKENWFTADGEYDFDDAGALSSLQFGIRDSRHTHDSLFAISQGPNWASAINFSPNSTLWPASTQSYSNPLSSGLGSVWYWTPSQLAQLDATYADRASYGPASRFYPQDIYQMTETNKAAYLQVNFAGSNWSGNAGVRLVGTDENIGFTSGVIQETDYTGPYCNSPWYPCGASTSNGWYWNFYKAHYTKALPSFNLKYNLNSDGSLLARFAASQTLTRQDYGQLAGFLTLNDPEAVGAVGSGLSPNPELKPLVSTNFDASLEWYFAPRGLLSASVYEMDLNNYYDYGTTTGTYLNSYLTFNKTTNPSGAPIMSQYLISRPVNVNGTLKGVELNWVQPIGDHFGTQASWTYANGHSSGGTYLYNADGTPGSGVAAGNRPLYGTSKNTVNLSAFYEDKQWNARINYTYRSSFYDGMMPVTAGSTYVNPANPGAGAVSNTMPLLPYYQAGTGYLSFSLGYTLNDNVSFSFDAMNLNNPKLRYYDYGYQAGLGFGKVPEAFYQNGRQYYLTANFKF
ncbi:TonB-dependent receptor [Rhodanobacter sp. 7MK24]|uniref:TonB-dependent receptor n=1 Tax=Rhodanobacter sp. 7MK24 TaxID=2775922 RepID=UPI00177CE940|nr:TonB-dependent receptor [Rhodanobacter sp. 7MK24]MBD8880126.1 TonB-dependent receptor [Rhodanobacter sp. 7MK24]